MGSHVAAAVVVGRLQIPDAAAWIAERLAPFADQLEFNGAVTVGAVGAALGRGGQRSGRHAEADDWFANAIRIADRASHRWAAADARLAWGEALTARGETDRARANLRDALESVVGLGFGYIERAARRELDGM